MLCTHGFRTNPFSILPKFNTALKHDVYHVFSTSVMRTNFNAATLPRFEHLITTVPFFPNHYAVVWLSIELIKLLCAEFDSLMKSAHITMILMFSWKLSLVVSSIYFNVVTLEESVQILVTDSLLIHFIVLVLYFNTHVLNNTCQIILADELICYFKARSMFEGAEKIVRAHDFVMLIDVTTFWYMSMHILNYNRIWRANFKAINLSTLS